MKWLLSRTEGEINIYPEKDILPHLCDIGCPCRTAVICLSKGESIKLELEEGMDEALVADENVTVILHNAIIEKLEHSTN